MKKILVTLIAAVGFIMQSSVFAADDTSTATTPTTDASTPATTTDDATTTDTNSEVAQ